MRLIEKPSPYELDEIVDNNRNFYIYPLTKRILILLKE